MKYKLHGVLLRVFETGVLLFGESGIGKSECALDLITKGHRLVADDALEIFIAADGSLIGRAPDLTRNLIEIRGLGIFDVSSVFGESATAEESKIDLCVELAEWSDHERLAEPVTEHCVFDVAIPKMTIPVAPGRNLGMLIETAVRLYRSGDAGHAAEFLLQEHSRLLNRVQ